MDKLAEIRQGQQSVTFTLRGAPALGVLLEAGQDVPRSAYSASRPLVAIYGLKAPRHRDGPWLLGTLEVADLEKRPRGKGARIRTLEDDPWTALSGEQVARLIDLVRGVGQMPGPRRRPSALADNPSFGRLREVLVEPILSLCS